MNNTSRFSPFLRLLIFLMLLAVFAVGAKALSPASASSPQQKPQPLDTVETLVMPPVDVQALLLEDELRAAQGLPPRFAQPIPVDVTPWNHGTWDTLSDGTSLWRLRVLSKGALSLNFGFTRYKMPEGGSLFLYPADRSRIVGPFTAADNETHGQLWSPILLGDEIVIEVSLPTDKLAEFELVLTSVNHGYAEFGKPHTIASGICNVDVVCPEGDAWREQIRSVAVISTGGSTFCTGFLVNNTTQDLKGYFMTANHCGIDPGNAASLVTYWNYQNSWCRPVGDPINGQPGDGQLNQFNTGSYFKSSYYNSDFTLVELDDPINPDFNVYWAGWDHSGNDATSATAIHHPNTDEKRISFEYHPTSVTSYLEEIVPGDGTHVRVTDWDVGTTEPGSSGSPLFDQNHRVIGQLHGGWAACGNDESDWYGRFYTSWTGGGSPTTRLSDWLDPINTGQPFLNGRNRVETPFEVIADPSAVSICAPDPAVYGITVTQETPGFENPVTLSILGVPDGALAEFSVNPVVPAYTSTLTITQTGNAEPGAFNMNLVGKESTNTFTTTVILDLFNDVPGIPTLLTPEDASLGQPLQPVFTWEGAEFSRQYNFRLDPSPLFPQPELAEGLLEPTYTPIDPLQGGKCYWWSVQDVNTCGEGSWAAPFHFATANLETIFADNMESGDANWTHEAVQGLDHWVISSDQSHSPAHAWFVPDDNTITDSRLWMTETITVVNNTQLTFWHLYQFEGSNFDGSVLEISTDGGNTWYDLGPYIIANGYNGVVDDGYSNPLANRDAWVDDLTTWTKVEVDLDNFAGHVALIRWRVGCDISVSDVGWYIDDVQITQPLTPNPAPELLNISPDSGSTYEDTPVVIEGNNFVETPSLLLGETWLTDVTQVNTTTLEAIVPAGIPAGTYDLTLYNGDCQVSILPEAFTVVEEVIPIEGLEARDSSPTIVGLATYLTATVTAGAPIAYTWDFGDGSFGEDDTVSHVYQAVGEYTAIVTATNSESTAVTNTLVTVVDVPISGLAADSDSPTLFGNLTTFTATITEGTNVVYTWDFGDESELAVGKIVNHEYARLGTYTVTLTASNTSGSTQVALEVEVLAPSSWTIYLPVLRK